MNQRCYIVVAHDQIVKRFPFTTTGYHSAVRLSKKREGQVWNASVSNVKERLRRGGEW